MDLKAQFNERIAEIADRPWGKGLAVLVVLSVLVALADKDEKAPAAKNTATSSKSEPAEDKDITRAYSIGEAAVRSGLAIEYEVSGWGGTIDLTIQSLSFSDAQKVADGVCATAGGGSWRRQWNVRVFLPISGDRPAATCSL